MRKKRLSPKEKDHIINLYNQGYTYDKLVLSTKRARSTIYRIIKKHNDTLYLNTLKKISNNYKNFSHFQTIFEDKDPSPIINIDDLKHHLPDYNPIIPYIHLPEVSTKYSQDQFLNLNNLKYIVHTVPILSNKTNVFLTPDKSPKKYNLFCTIDELNNFDYNVALVSSSLKNAKKIINYSKIYIQPWSNDLSFHVYKTIQNDYNYDDLKAKLDYYQFNRGWIYHDSKSDCGCNDCALKPVDNVHSFIQTDYFSDNINDAIKKLDKISEILLEEDKDIRGGNEDFIIVNPSLDHHTQFLKEIDNL